MGIFRGFKALGIKNILYLHAEQVGLEKELRKCEEEGHESGDNVRVNYRRCWQPLKLSDGEPCSESSR